MATAKVGNSSSDLSCSWFDGFKVVWALLLSSLQRQWRGCLEVQEDVSTELFFACMEAHQKIGSGETIENLPGLVRTIANRRLLRKYASLKRRWQREINGGIAVETFESLKARDAPVPENPYIQRLADVIADLPTSNRELAKLSYVDGYSPGEIAQLLDENEGTIKMRLHRLKLHIKTELGV
jgi:RNA polymerase sigma factor (sigma-70 family)